MMRLRERERERRRSFLWRKLMPFLSLLGIRDCYNMFLARIFIA
jgi:hypothetical protein